MIAGLRGTVEGRTVDGLLVGVGGLILHVHVPTSVLAACPPVGERLFLHTYLHLREDSVALYGFGSEQERDVFRVLLGVNGVGPRVSMALLSSLGIARLGAAVAQEQIDVLSAVSGVGKRTAARLVLELKGKLAVELDGLGEPDATTLAARTIAALTGLGYGAQEAQDAWRSLAPEDRTSVEQAVRACLGYLAEKRIG